MEAEKQLLEKVDGEKSPDLHPQGGAGESDMVQWLDRSIAGSPNPGPGISCGLFLPGMESRNQGPGRYCKASGKTTRAFGK